MSTSNTQEMLAPADKFSPGFLEEIKAVDPSTIKEIIKNFANDFTVACCPREKETAFRVIEFIGKQTGIGTADAEIPIEHAIAITKWSLQRDVFPTHN